jgi:hypothetical protein
MILATSFAIGFFTATLRSSFAVIAVAFMIGLVFVAALVISGASLFGLLMSVLGFNLGLITFGAGYLVASSGTAG